MYIMKISAKYIVIILAFLFIIFLSMGASTHFTPFAFSKSKLNMYTYEGFDTEYSSYPQNQVIDSVLSTEAGPVSKITGFSGLLLSPNTPEKAIDIYSQAQGEKTGKSYGLMNSTGYLSLNKEQIQQLTTRGGNMSSGESTIG